MAAGSIPRYLGARLGSVDSEDGDPIEVDATLETMPAVLFDAVAVPGGKKAVETLGTLGHAIEFLKDQYRHAKPLLALGPAAALLENAGVSSVLPNEEPDPGVLVEEEGNAARALPKFVKAIARHRHYEREQDPPPV
jgi:catalase